MTFRSERKWMYMMFILVIMTVIVAAKAFTMPPGDGAKSGEQDQEKMVGEVFALESGGKLQVNVEDMDIHIKTGAKGESSVEVFVSGRDMDKARSYFEKLKFDAHLKGNTLVVTCKEPSISFWNSKSHIKVWAVITVPQDIDVNIQTEDGDIWSESVSGNVRAFTEDGDIEIQDINGGTIEVGSEDGDIDAGSLTAKEVALEAEDGDIRAQSLKGDVITVKTSDGDIQIDRIQGVRVSIGTSDGDIRMSRIEGGDIAFKSSDGDIDIAVSGQRLDMRCSDGDITVRMLSQLEADLTVGDGDVTLTLPKNAGADLDIKGGEVSVRSKIAMQGRLSKNHIKGSINDGGPLIRVRAGDGSIRVDEK